MQDLLQQFADIEPAPKQPARKGILDAKTLATELALGTLQLILNGEGVTHDGIKRVRPVVAQAYTKAYSVLPSYLGTGRSKDGLRLWRAAGQKAYSASRQNGGLALRKLHELGVDLEEVAADLGYPSAAALAEVVAKLPPHQSGTPCGQQES